MWPDNRVLDLLGIQSPIIQAPMAGSGDFTPLWSGQAARLSRELPAAELTKRLAAETLKTLTLLSQKGADS